MQYAFSNCEFTKINLDKYPNHDYLIEGVWLDTDKEHKVTVKAPDLYKYHQGELIQDCFPYLSRKDREFLITGTWLEPPTMPQHEDEPISSCCGAEFGFPGHPDSDLCSACGEHASPDYGEEEFDDDLIHTITVNADKAKDNKNESK